jgi:hypothetical protein
MVNIKILNLIHFQKSKKKQQKIMLMNCNNNYAKEIKNGADGTLVITSKKKC